VDTMFTRLAAGFKMTSLAAYCATVRLSDVDPLYRP